MKNTKKQIFRSLQLLYHPAPDPTNETPSAPLHLQIRLARYLPQKEGSAWKAVVSLEINQVIKICGIKLIAGEKGPFFSYPSVASKNKSFYLPLVRLPAVDFKQFIEAEFLKLYLETLEEGKDESEAEAVVQALTAGVA